MIRCQHCGGEVEEGRGFCPHCGKAVSSDAEVAAQAPGAAAAPPRVVTAPSFGRPREEPDKSRRVIFAAVAVVALALVAGLAYLATRPSARPGEERLAGAIRPGSQEFPATIGATALGTWAVTMKTTVRNFTGRIVNGLEFHASGVDPQGKVIRERTFVSEAEIEPNKTFVPSIGLNFPQDNKPADLKLELTGVRFK